MCLGGVRGEGAFVDGEHGAETGECGKGGREEEGVYEWCWGDGDSDLCVEGGERVDCCEGLEEGECRGVGAE